MKIVVLHGSPSGSNSVTLHCVEYLKRQLAEHDFEVIDCGQPPRDQHERRLYGRP